MPDKTCGIPVPACFHVSFCAAFGFHASERALLPNALGRGGSGSL